MKRLTPFLICALLFTSCSSAWHLGSGGDKVKNMEQWKLDRQQKKADRSAAKTPVIKFTTAKN